MGVENGLRPIFHECPVVRLSVNGPTIHQFYFFIKGFEEAIFIGGKLGEEELDIFNGQYEDFVNQLLRSSSLSQCLNNRHQLVDTERSSSPTKGRFSTLLCTFQLLAASRGKGFLAPFSDKLLIAYPNCCSISLRSSPISFIFSTEETALAASSTLIKPTVPATMLLRVEKN